MPPGPTVPVWAPRAESLGLHIVDSGEVLDMLPRPGGWFESPRALSDGTRYAYRIDGSEEDRPDPRSALQPEGVHGPSQLVDLSRFPWTDASWTGRDARGAVTYELHAGTFTPEGTLDAAAGHLDHLAGLGVEMVELMPLAGFPGRAGWGYDGVDLWAVHEAYGGPAALARFVDAAHARGIAVCLDVVYNHLGPSGNYLALFGPYFTPVHTTPWGEAVNMDQPGCEQVRAFIIDSALRWLRDLHVDALRLDAIHAIADDAERSTSVPPHPHILAELARAVGELAGELGRPLSLIAESDLNDAGVITPVDEDPPASVPSLGMTAQWADDVHHALHSRFTGESQGYYADFAVPGALEAVFDHGFLHDGGFSSFRGRDWGAPMPEGTDPRRLVVFASDHDQVGNRAVGDRPAASMPDGLAAAEAALVLLSPFTPMLFMGEEWGTRRPFQFFTDHVDPGLGEAVSAGRVREFAAFGWDAARIPDPQSPATVEASRLDWSEPEQPGHARMLAWYRALIALRRRLRLGDAASWGRLREQGEILVLTVPVGAVDGAVDRLAVIANLGAAEAEAASLLGADGAARLEPLASFADDATWQGASPLTVPPTGALVVLVHDAAPPGSAAG